MYIENIYYIRPGVIEHEQVHSSMVGNHSSRSARADETTETVKKNNTRYVAKKLRRLIDANFEPGDMYITLTYKRGSKKDLEDIEKDWDKFCAKLKYRYTKRGSPLKWISVAGVNAPHVHCIINKIEGFDFMKELPALWKHGHVHIEPLYIEDGRYMQLAQYLVKHKDENEKKLKRSLKGKKAYRSSRNLTKPRVRRIKINERTILRKPKVPTGYQCVDQISGTSEQSGYCWRYFYLIKKVRKRE